MLEAATIIFLVLVTKTNYIFGLFSTTTNEDFEQKTHCRVENTFSGGRGTC